ncbi:hypothetical protein [Herpetosiphon gulosus]|uniref:Uncharacterized protein n=1 Tax=Herpetosiphon gulosus TaxID=1973496 RepID=A0ABP9X2P2_9CHLR
MILQKLAPHKPTVIVWFSSLTLICMQLLLPFTSLNLLLAIVTVPGVLLSSYAIWIIFFRPRSLQARLQPRRAHDPTIPRKKPRWRYNTYQDPPVHLPNVDWNPIDPDFIDLDSLGSSNNSSRSGSGDSSGAW